VRSFRILDRFLKAIGNGEYEFTAGNKGLTHGGQSPTVLLGRCLRSKELPHLELDGSIFYEGSIFACRCKEPFEKTIVDSVFLVDFRFARDEEK
jgi:hypothetical protein